MAPPKNVWKRVGAGLLTNCQAVPSMSQFSGWLAVGAWFAKLTRSVSKFCGSPAVPRFLCEWVNSPCNEELTGLIHSPVSVLSPAIHLWLSFLELARQRNSKDGILSTDVELLYHPTYY